MPTLTQVAREMIKLEPACGLQQALASATATTAVVLDMAQGTLENLSEKWVLKRLVRRDAATAAGADRERAIASAVFAAGTGVTFTHAGTNYTDVTGSPEVLELWNFDGRLVDMCIQVALSKLMRLDRTPLIGYRGNQIGRAHV